MKRLLLVCLWVTLILSACQPAPVILEEVGVAEAGVATSEQAGLDSTRLAETPEEVLPTQNASTPTPDPVAFEEISSQNYWVDKLASSSQAFIALAPEDADLIARQIAFLGGNGESASNSCGPLTVAILQEAGLLPRCLSNHFLWLLNLRGEESQIRVLTEYYFPPQAYDYFWHEESIRDYDFTADPLMPGDWMFLFTAGNGYDHMLVVTRIDADGAVYSVTNFDRGEGFIISEELLYDPNAPGEGLFYELTDLVGRRLLGLTGSGGFLLVRRKGGLAAIPQWNDRLCNGLTTEADWHIYLKNLTTGRVLFENLPNHPFHPASMIKVPLVMVALDILHQQDIGVADFTEKGFGGRTFDQLFTATIVQSEELAAEALWNFINANGGAAGLLTEWGIDNTWFEPRRTTAYDLAAVLEGLYEVEFLQPEYNAYLLDLMRVETESDAEYAGVITGLLPGAAYANKRGLLVSPVIVSDMGILTYDEQAYLIIIHGSLKADGGARYEDLQEGVESFARDVGDLLLEDIEF